MPEIRGEERRHGAAIRDGADLRPTGGRVARFGGVGVGGVDGGEVVMIVEAIFGIIVVALATGLVFTKFSVIEPDPRVSVAA